MRWVSRAVAATLGLGIASGVFPGLVSGQTVAQDSAVGNVTTVIFRPEAFVFDARSGPSGESPGGSVTWSDRTDVMQGPVTCLNVTGNRATIGFENLGTGASVLNGGLLFVEDNGTPGASRDNARGRLVVSAPTICPPNTEIYDAFSAVTSGELTVHDAPAFPTAKTKCKKGGWRNFLGFSRAGPRGPAGARPRKEPRRLCQLRRRPRARTHPAPSSAEVIGH